ncbi:MAG TPA: polysaccharide deacetylase family protein [Chitinophagaceae bacterium]|nr:polysaccharide deacetylase family protein [Chitinophagaceae bacterium]
MKKLFTVFAHVFMLTFLCEAQQLTLQERLGYPKDAKLLIIHADDLGVSHSQNQASIYALEKGSVSSASIMVPTPWFSEIAAYAVAHPKADLGLHLTLTSEWRYYKWGPVACDVPGLKNKEGYFYSDVDSVYKYAPLDEIEKELRAQIEKAKSAGIDFTHFDSHMVALFGRPDYLKLLIKLGKEYKVPVLLASKGPRSIAAMHLDSSVTNKNILLDHVYTASPADFKGGMPGFYARVFRSLRPGVSIVIIHTAYDDNEMQSVTVDHTDWGAAWRQADFNFFTGDQCKKLLEEQHIHVITWREIRDKLLR